MRLQFILSVINLLAYRLKLVQLQFQISLYNVFGLHDMLYRKALNRKYVIAEVEAINSENLFRYLLINTAITLTGVAFIFFLSLIAHNVNTK